LFHPRLKRPFNNKRGGDEQLVTRGEVKFGLALPRKRKKEKKLTLTDLVGDPVKCTFGPANGNNAGNQRTFKDHFFLVPEKEKVLGEKNLGRTGSKSFGGGYETLWKFYVQKTSHVNG